MGEGTEVKTKAKGAQASGTKCKARGTRGVGTQGEDRGNGPGVKSEADGTGHTERLVAEGRPIGSRRRQVSVGSEVTCSNATSCEGLESPPVDTRATVSSENDRPHTTTGCEAQAWAEKLRYEDLGWKSRRRRGSNGSSVTDSNATIIGDNHEKMKKSTSLCIVTGNGGGARKTVRVYAGGSHIAQ